MASDVQFASHIDQSVSFPSKGLMRNEDDQLIQNDHSDFVDVNGTGHWLHRDKYAFDGERVHMPLHHAIDNSLIEATPENAVSDKVTNPGSDQQVIPTKAHSEPASEVTLPSGDGSKTTPGAQSKLNNKGDEAKTK